MANTYAQDVVGFLPTLDTLYKREALTSIFETNAGEWSGKKKIMIPSIEVQGNGDYDRAKGYVAGGINVEYQEVELKHDRGRMFVVDAVEEDEVPFDLIRSAMVEFERNRNIPEIDAIRFAKLSQVAGNKVSKDLATSQDAIDSYEYALESATSKGMNFNNAVMFVSAKFMRLIREYIKPSISANTNNGVLNRNITVLDNGLKLITVENDRFHDEIKLLSGGSGQEAGGYEPVSGTSHLINFLIVELGVPRAVAKRKANKFFTPDQHQTLDAYTFAYRTFHDIYVADKQAVKLYAHVMATPVA